MREPNFGWDLPPGVTQQDIDRAYGYADMPDDDREFDDDVEEEPVREEEEGEPGVPDLPPPSDREVEYPDLPQQESEADEWEDRYYEVGWVDAF